MKKLGIILLGLAMVGLTNCRREKDTNATVIVVDASENPVVGASVRLYVANATGPVREGIEKTETTGSDGTARFNYNDLYELGQAGFAVLDVDINGGQASGIIKIEEEVENEQTVICQTC